MNGTTVLRSAKQNWWIVPGFLSLLPLIIAGAALGAGRDELSERFQAHIDYLASEELGGRGIGEPGIELAAEYLAREFESVGLRPGGENGKFYQSFEIALHRELRDDGRLEISGDSVTRRQSVDFIPFNFSSDDEFSGPLVFAGYGISNEERKYDDFAGVDLTGAVALIFSGEPPSWADSDGAPTRSSMLRNKAYNVKDRGAVAVLVVSPKRADQDQDSLTKYVAHGADQYGIPAFHVTRAWAEWATTAARLGALDALLEKLDAGRPATAAMAHMKASGRASFNKRTATTRNVLGVHRGRGPLAEEYIVIGAHYDHLGIQVPMIRKFKDGKVVQGSPEPKIHYGADDNASGTGALIEIARLLAAGPPTSRSVLFIAFTAEESGLHGSKHFVENPTIPLEKTVAMLNMDMIGRMNPDEETVQVFGADCGSTFPKFLESVGREVGLKIAPGVSYGGRSDHAPFIHKNIPSMHFYTGAHPDYHQPSDTADKINAAGGAKVVRLVAGVAAKLAESAERPSFVMSEREKARSEPMAATATFRVVMGLTPSYGDDGRAGMGVDAVSPEGPAERAGMKAGDRIVRINGKSIANVYDYMAATRNNKAGETVDVVVVRDGSEQELKVVLASAR